jgi:chemotaxis response regulator CheB
MTFTIALVTDDPDAMSILAAGLAAHSAVTLEWIPPSRVFSMLETKTPDVIILDQPAGGSPNFELVRGILVKNACINLVMVSTLAPEEFHEASEGLGILTSLPPRAGMAEAESLLDLLTRMGFLT